MPYEIGPVNQTRLSQAVMAGGLNVAAPTLSLTPGEAIQLHNYEVNELGRYRRVLGYERFDGRLSPSEATYISITVDDVEGLEVGGEAEGLTSGATGIIVAIDVESNTICVVAVSGTFEMGEDLVAAGGWLLWNGAWNDAGMWVDEEVWED